MIPGDLASRLRVILESSVQAVSVAHEISPDLPRMQPGQRIIALIESPLPDGSFRALVAGKSITLALPETVKSGDTLELQVTEQRGNTVHARLASQAGLTAGSTNDQPRPVLSQAGQIISQLLTGRHGEAKPLPLTQGSSLLASNAAHAAVIAPALRQAVKQSGMFYESHLRQWVEGKLPLSSLMAEPQAQNSARPAPAALQTPTTAPAQQEAPAETNPKPATETRAQTPATTASLDKNTSASAAAERPSLSNTPPDSTTKLSGSRIAETLTPVVLQQLEAIASNQLNWQGQVLPGMQVQWALIKPDEQDAQTTADDEDYVWRSKLRVDLPNLGGIQARLMLGPQGLSLMLDTDNSLTAEEMRAHQSSLQQALEAAGISLRQLTVSEYVRA